MKLIKNAEFGGERPLFESHDLRPVSYTHLTLPTIA